MGEKIDELKIIDWDEAMNQVGGDREFLSEVLQDFLNESNTAEDEIAEGIRLQDFTAVMKAAHRIKGSASYLCCEQLRWYSWKLQDVGQVTSQNPTAELRAEVDELFKHYRNSLIKLKEEIAQDLDRK